MSVNAADVLTASGADSSDSAIAQAVLDEANAYVTDYITENLIDATKPVPAAISDAAVLKCAVDLFAARKAPFGQQIGADLNGTPVITRLGSDPLQGVRPKLRPWCLNVGFAYPEETV